MQRDDKVMIVSMCKCGDEKRLGSVFTVAQIDPPDFIKCNGCGAHLFNEPLVHLGDYPYDDPTSGHPQRFLRKLDPLLAKTPLTEVIMEHQKFPLKYKA